MVARSTLQELGSQVLAASETLYETQYSLEVLNQQIETATNEVSVKEAELAKARSVLKTHVRGVYKAGKVSPLLMLFEKNGIETLSSYPYYAEKVIEQDNKVVQDVQAAQTALDEQIHDLEEKKALHESLLEQQQLQLSAFRNAQEMQQSYVQNLDQALVDRLNIEAEQERLQELATAGDVQAQLDLEALQSEAEDADSVASSIVPFIDVPAGTTVSVADITGSARSTMTPAMRAAILNAAFSQLGVPYLLGGEQPGVALDCSGFVQYCYRQVGIELPHSAAAQSLVAQSSSIDKLQPGDLIFWIGTADPRITGNHVAIYIGNGKIIHAVLEGVRIQSLYGGYTKFGVIL